MTAADRQGGASRAVLRCTRAVVITLIAVVAVLVHHDTWPIPHHVPLSRAAHHTLDTAHHTVDTAYTVGTAPTVDMRHHSDMFPSPHPRGHTAAAATYPAATPIASDGHGACSGTAGQHCSTASVDTTKLTPPAQAATVGRTPTATHSLTPAGRNVLKTVDRAPPDLSLLSRLLL